MKKQQKQQRRQERIKNEKNVREKRREREYAPVAVSELQRFAGGSRQGRKSWRFSGSELVGGVLGSVAFETTKYTINPGLSSSFPWLAGEADKWEQYRFHRLCYRYVPRCASTTVGSVLLSPDYNVRDQPPSSEVEAADTFGAAESSAWSGFKADLDVSSMFPFGPRKMTRSSVVAGDMNLYDSGALYVSTTGEVDASLIGKLWVDYEVELFVPQNSPEDSLGASRAAWATKESTQTYTTNTEASMQFDAFEFNPLGILQNGVGDTFTPKAGCYLISSSSSFADSTAESFSAEMSIRKNGITVNQSFTSGSVGHQIGVCQAIISCNGSENITVGIRLIGAAGTLTSVAKSPSISFVPA